MQLSVCPHHFKLTWIPNEIEGFDLVLFESPERLMQPKAWLVKLWECVTLQGLVVITGTTEWDASHVRTFIGKW